MARRKAANLLKGVAWLLLAAAVLPTFATSAGPAGEVTELTVGLPWSPWLVYRESWSRPSALLAAPVLSYATTLEPRCWSAAVFVAGMALILLSRIIRITSKTPPRPVAARIAPSGAVSA